MRGSKVDHVPQTKQAVSAATRRVRYSRHALPVAMLLLLTACGGRGPTEDILPGGIPARTNLHEASNLPSDSVRTVARREYGWRLIYHPSRAPGNAEQGAARALCGLESRRVERIERVPRIDPYSDPGAAIIDVFCA